MGGIISLLTPELENHLVGFVALNSTPKLWLEAAAQCAKKYNLPDFVPEMQTFIQHPSQETFDKTLYDETFMDAFMKKFAVSEKYLIDNTIYVMSKDADIIGFFSFN